MSHAVLEKRAERVQIVTQGNFFDFHPAAPRHKVLNLPDVDAARGRRPRAVQEATYRADRFLR